MNFPKYSLPQFKGISGEVFFEYFVITELECIYHRNDRKNDFGVDGFIEFVLKDANGGKVVTGKCIAVQLKHGNSHYAKNGKTPKSHKYSEKSKDRLGYYLNVSSQTPVFFIIMNDDFSSIYWVKLSDGDIDYTSVGWRIEIPKNNNINAKTKTK